MNYDMLLCEEFDALIPALTHMDDSGSITLQLLNTFFLHFLSLLLV